MPLLCDENRRPYTGIAKAYSSKLKISPLTARVSGLVYFADGYALGWSRSPEEFDGRILSAYPLTAPSPEFYEQAGLTMPLHKAYLSTLETELQSWGSYLCLPGQLPEDPDTALYLDGGRNVHLAEITLSLIHI